MMSNSNTSNNNNNHPKTNEANLLATVDSVVTTAAAAHQQQQQQQPHHLLVAANKYQQELIDNELNEKANAILKKSYKQQNNSSNPMKLNPASLQQQTRHQVYGKSVYDKVKLFCNFLLNSIKNGTRILYVFIVTQLENEILLPRGK